MSRIYLSYDHRDATAVRRLAAALEQRGFKVWFDPMTLKAGESWDGEIERAFRQTDVYIACWSRNSTESDWVEREAFHAHLLGRLVCANIDSDLDLDELPRFCRSYPMLDLQPRSVRSLPDPYLRIVEAVRNVAARKIVLEDRPLASEPQALANNRRGIDLIPGLLRDRDRSTPRETKFGHALRDLSRSSFGHVRFAVDKFVATNPTDSGEACLAPLQAAIEESNDAALWGLYGDVLAPFEPMAAFTAYRRSGFPGDYIDRLVPERERREAYIDSPSGRRRSGMRAALATAAAFLVLVAAGVVGLTQINSNRDAETVQVTYAEPASSVPARVTREEATATASSAPAPKPEWGEVQTQMGVGGPSGEDVRANGRTGDLPVLPPAPEPAPIVSVPTPAPAPPPLPVAESSSSTVLPQVALTPSGVIRLCRAGEVQPGERIEVVQPDESIGKFALRVSQGGTAQIYERNKACLDDLSRQIVRADGSVIAGRDLVFPGDVLIIPADLPPPIWMLIRPA